MSAYTYAWHSHHDAPTWAAAAAAAISAGLRDSLGRRERARLLLSGGGTPAPVYQLLSQADLDWTRVDVALVDERWLLPDDPQSNAFLIRTHLLQGPAAQARFEALTGPGRSIEEATATANLHADTDAHATTDATVVLGMGLDGHTASLFPGMIGLDTALMAPQAYVAVDATGCAGAGAWHRRISLTPAGLAPARTRLLLIRGEEKRALFERAAQGRDPLELPVRIAFTTPGAVLHVHWAP